MYDGTAHQDSFCSEYVRGRNCRARHTQKVTRSAINSGEGVLNLSSVAAYRCFVPSQHGESRECHCQGTGTSAASSIVLRALSPWSDLAASRQSRQSRGCLGSEPLIGPIICPIHPSMVHTLLFFLDPVSVRSGCGTLCNTLSTVTRIYSRFYTSLFFTVIQYGQPLHVCHVQLAVMELPTYLGSSLKG
jgi:hypothetical protein